MADSSKVKKIVLGVAGGCLGLILLCCLSGYVAFYVRQTGIEDASRTHAETFLGHVQAADWNAVLIDSEYQSGYSTYTLRSAEQLQTCFSDTALGDMTSFECDDVSVEPMENDGDVTCTVSSATRGEHEITVHVNGADATPYLGFVFFDEATAFGSVWSSDQCTLSSGREYYESPPEGRVRPMATP